MKGLSIVAITILLATGLAPGARTAEPTKPAAATAKGKGEKETPPPAPGKTAPAKGTPPATGQAPSAAKKAEPKPSDALLKWVDTCIAQLASTDEVVRSGAQAALRVAGEAARPALEKATKGTSPGVAEQAHKLLAHADRREAAAKASKPESPSTEVAAITQRLGLTEEQKPKVEAIVADYEQKHQAMADDVLSGGLARDAAKEKNQVLTDDLNAKLATVLTADQMKRYMQERERLQPRPKPAAPK
jgi:hypothetical protein